MSVFEMTSESVEAGKILGSFSLASDSSKHSNGKKKKSSKEKKDSNKHSKREARSELSADEAKTSRPILPKTINAEDPEDGAIKLNGTQSNSRKRMKLTDLVENMTNGDTQEIDLQNTPLIARAIPSREGATIAAVAAAAAESPSATEIANTLSSSSSSSSSVRPPVGSPAWELARRESHKKVERRRREHINAGVDQLSKIVPDCGKNKGTILHQAVLYITKLQEQEALIGVDVKVVRDEYEKKISELQDQIAQLKKENKSLRSKSE
ncbi:putative bHLH domain-containing protein [Zancudomyces culisetae]|uniref:Putative bHLH domain-containing protein n=1 Tax=Zancudomyces culisetae TaxID=1213189 RepID=A0A1R1PJK6_ZANCU|nr:putative bHLH domain-containing protein [Zancudomyces culisetae]|eukprot:OMH81062.1 putative bHLH domain-containing protein [Zancudomyces culisetae]